MSKPEVYISVDIEASGPIPGEYSMLSLGACVVGDPSRAFQCCLKPISDKFVPEALAVTGTTLEQAAQIGLPPEHGMREFAEWLAETVDGQVPVFVGFNASFDWSFVNWYFHHFLGQNPFGIGALDIKAFYMGLSGCSWQKTTSRQLPAQFQPATPQTHNALDDAQAQADIFGKMLAASERRISE